MIQLQLFSGGLRPPQAAKHEINPNSRARRQSVQCVSVPESQSESASSPHHPTASTITRRLFGAGTALAAALVSTALPAAQAASVLDGQGLTRVLPLASEEDLSIPERQVLEYNKRTQRQNGAPPDFPLFVREGFDMTVLTPEGYQVTPDGIIYKDYAEGTGNFPEEGQQVTFDYTAYNESAGVIDSSYRKGQPAQTRIGIQGLIPGFELGIKSMKPGGKRRIVVPPELGPPVGPSTFFSSKQFEIFDVELRAAKTCVRRSVGMFSDVVCE